MCLSARYANFEHATPRQKGETTPNDGKTCVGDPSIKCTNDAECGSKKPCEASRSGATCAMNGLRPCLTNADCLPNDGPCTGPSFGGLPKGGKLCARDPSIVCTADIQCGKKGPVARSK